MSNAAWYPASFLKGRDYIAVNGKIVSRSILPALHRSCRVWLRMTGNDKIDPAFFKP